MNKKYLILFLIFVIIGCSRSNPVIDFYNCPSKVLTNKTSHSLRYRIIAGKNDILLVEEVVYKNGFIISQVQYSEDANIFIKSNYAKDFSYFFNSENNNNTFVIEIKVIDLEENEASTKCIVEFNLP